MNFLPRSALRIQEFAQYPTMRLVGSRTLSMGDWFDLRSPVQAAAVAGHFSQPLRVEVSRPFSRISLVHSFLLSSFRTDPLACSIWEMVLLSLGHQFDNFYQTVVDWWNKEALVCQPASFPSGSSPNFSRRSFGFRYSLPGGRVCTGFSPFEDGPRHLVFGLLHWVPPSLSSLPDAGWLICNQSKACCSSFKIVWTSFSQLHNMLF